MAHPKELSIYGQAPYRARLANSFTNVKSVFQGLLTASTVFTMNIQITTMMLVLALLVLCVSYVKNSDYRQDSRTSQKAKWDSRIAAGLCPVCDGKPFEQILMNGCTGCIDCASTGKAKAYLTRRV